VINSFTGVFTRAGLSMIWSSLIGIGLGRKYQVDLSEHIQYEWQEEEKVDKQDFVQQQE